MHPMPSRAHFLPSITDLENLTMNKRCGASAKPKSSLLLYFRLMSHAARAVMMSLIAFAFFQIPDTEANASAIKIDDNRPHPQAQSNVGLPTITILPDTDLKLYEGRSDNPALEGYAYESSQEVPFRLSRSDGAAGELTVDLRVTDVQGGYVESENTGDKTVTLTFDIEGTAPYVIPSVLQSGHADGIVTVEVLADSTDPAEYSVGEPSSALVHILHGHEDEDIQTGVIVDRRTPIPFTFTPVESTVLEGQDAEFKIALPSCATSFGGICGEVTIVFRVVQIGDYIDVEKYDTPDEDEHEDEHEDEDDVFEFQTVTIPDGVGEHIFSVPTVDDDVVEADGTIIVILFSVDNDHADVRVEADDSSSTVTIKSDDPPAVTVSLPDNSPKTEGDDIVFQIERTGPFVFNEIPVRIQSADTGNFLQNSETTTVTIPANRVSTTHTVSTFDDTHQEEHGSVTLTVLDDIADPAVYRVGVPSSATAVVADNDPLDLRFDDPDDATRERVPITKAVPVPQAGSVGYRVKLTKQPDADVKVTITTNNPDVTVQPSQIIFTTTSPQGPGFNQAMDTANPRSSAVTVPWDHPVHVRIIANRIAVSGTMATLTHRVSCREPGSDCGYTSAGEHIDVQVIAPDVASPRISRIEPKIRSITVSPGERAGLTVHIFGRQNIQDQSLGTYLIEWRQGDDRIEGFNGPKITYTAPTAPGIYTVTAKVAGNACSGDEDDCSAPFEIRVRRPSTPQPTSEPAINPTGQIPSVIVDADGNQYEVFTPEQGGKFDGTERYGIAAEPGAVPNGEILGVRMSESGAASNSGMTHHRYTIGGNSYAIQIADASGNKINAYRLNNPAEVCIPLPPRTAEQHLEVGAGITQQQRRFDDSFSASAAQPRRPIRLRQYQCLAAHCGRRDSGSPGDDTGFCS